jgi:hypothetical protein
MTSENSISKMRQHAPPPLASHPLSPAPPALLRRGSVPFTCSDNRMKSSLKQSEREREKRGKGGREVGDGGG